MLNDIYKEAQAASRISLHAYVTAVLVSGTVNFAIICFFPTPFFYRLWIAIILTQGFICSRWIKATLHFQDLPRRRWPWIDLLTLSLPVIGPIWWLLARRYGSRQRQLSSCLTLVLILIAIAVVLIRQ